MTKESIFYKSHPKVEKIRRLCKTSKQCKELYTPILEAYDRDDMELPDLLVQFGMMEMKRKTSGFNFNNCKDERKNIA